MVQDRGGLHGIADHLVLGGVALARPREDVPAFALVANHIAEHVGHLVVEADVSHLVVGVALLALRLAQELSESLLVVGGGQPGHPLRGGELHPLPGSRGA